MVLTMMALRMLPLTLLLLLPHLMHRPLPFCRLGWGCRACSFDRHNERRRADSCFGVCSLLTFICLIEFDCVPLMRGLGVTGAGHSRAMRCMMDPQWAHGGKGGGVGGGDGGKWRMINRSGWGMLEQLPEWGKKRMGPGEE